MSISDYTLGSLLNETESDFQSFGVINNPFYKYINTISRQIPGGANIIGALNEKAKLLWQQAGAGPGADHILAPGNRDLSYGDDELFKVGLGLPVDYDVWYMFFAGNILLKGQPSDYERDEWIEKSLEKMEDYIKEIDSTETLKALRQPLAAEAKSTVINSYGGTADGFSGMSGGPVNTDISGGWGYAVKEARFETMVLAQSGASPLLGEFKATDSPYFASKEGEYDSSDKPPSPLFGPKEPDSDPYCGYIAFPVGPLGVMWSVSLATESSLSDGTTGGSSIHPIHPADAEATVVEGKQMLPPFELAQSETAGEKLIKKGYLVVDNSVVELTANKFDDIDNPPVHQWMRYWIKASNTMIIPGEFVGMLCRPWPLHCWWYQESAPFIYAGNWIETEFYTSGVVKCVMEPWTAPGTSPPPRGDTDKSAYYDEDNFDFDVGSKLYVVWVKNEEIIVASSDFKEYEVDTRVGLLKCVRDGDAETHVNAEGSYDALAGTSDKFSWEALKWLVLKGKSTPDKDIFTMEWVAVPVDFFETAGNSVGGA